MYYILLSVLYVIFSIVMVIEMETKNEVGGLFYSAFLAGTITWVITSMLL